MLSLPASRIPLAISYCWGCHTSTEPGQFAREVQGGSPSLTPSPPCLHNTPPLLYRAETWDIYHIYMCCPISGLIWLEIMLEQNWDFSVTPRDWDNYSPTPARGVVTFSVTEFLLYWTDSPGFLPSVWYLAVWYLHTSRSSKRTARTPRAR